MSSSTDISELSRYSTRPRRSLRHKPAVVSGGQLFFEFDAPEAFISPQLFAVNPRGDMIYSVKIDMKLTLDPDTHEVVVVIGNRLICRCSIHTGKSVNYVIDNDITANELREATDFYLLSDNIAVLITYNPENYHFSQYVLVMNDTTEKALLTVKRTVTLPALNSNLSIGTGLLDEGFVLVTGYTGPDGENRQVVGHLIAADPLQASVLPNKDITPMIRQFERFLAKHDPDLHIFAPGILAERNGLTFLLKSTEYDLFETTVVGRATYNPNGNRVLCKLMPLDNSSVLYSRLLCIRHLRQVCHRDENIWMTIISSDFAQLNSWKWKVYLSALLYIMPSMIPVTAPPPAFNMYGLDMKSLKFRRVPIKPKLYTVENTLVSYPLAIDCDRTGGVITAELGSSLKVNYFPSQNAPPSLCKLAEHSVYRCLYIDNDIHYTLCSRKMRVECRLHSTSDDDLHKTYHHESPVTRFTQKPSSRGEWSALDSHLVFDSRGYFPAFEKSPLLRRSVGQLNWDLI